MPRPPQRYWNEKKVYGRTRGGHKNVWTYRSDGQGGFSATKKQVPMVVAQEPRLTYYLVNPAGRNSRKGMSTPLGRFMRLAKLKANQSAPISFEDIRATGAFSGTGLSPQQRAQAQRAARNAYRSSGSNNR